MRTFRSLAVQFVTRPSMHSELGTIMTTLSFVRTQVALDCRTETRGVGEVKCFSGWLFLRHRTSWLRACRVRHHSAGSTTETQEYRRGKSGTRKRLAELLNQAICIAWRCTPMRQSVSLPDYSRRFIAAVSTLFLRHDTNRCDFSAGMGSPSAGLASAAGLLIVSQISTNGVSLPRSDRSPGRGQERLHRD